MSNCSYKESKEGCFICWSYANKKYCCFDSAENGLKVCKTCKTNLPKNQNEFIHWAEIKLKEGK